jgi:hypothetical protein
VDVIEIESAGDYLERIALRHPGLMRGSSTARSELYGGSTTDEE